MNQDGQAAENSDAEKKNPDVVADDDVIDAEVDDDADADAIDMSEGSGDLDALANMTRSDTFDAQAFAASNASRPGGAQRPRPKPKASSLKSTAVFPVITVGLVLLGFAIYGIMLMTGTVTKANGGTLMPRVMLFVAGPLGLILEALGVGLLLSVIDDKKKADALAAEKEAAQK